jgi:hypothetical protein
MFPPQLLSYNCKCILTSHQHGAHTTQQEHMSTDVPIATSRARLQTVSVLVEGGLVVAAIGGLMACQGRFRASHDG